MKPRHFFPLGKAYGEAFCNRTEETKKLIGNIENGKHTFLIAPRRYGKSSLCERAFELTKLPQLKLDFHLTVNTTDVERIIINGVSTLIGKSIGSIEKLAHLVKKNIYVKKLQPKLAIGTNEFRLELGLTKNSSPAENIVEALLLLEKLLRERDKQAVLLLDEFQEIGELVEAKGIEGAIRHAAQETHNLSFVFSGSSPHLLKRMFEDERSPLYKLCRKLVLGRISDIHYQNHINKAAKIMWGKPLEKDVFEHIMLVSERHPYYVNYLCDEIWSETNTLPCVKDIDIAWDMVIEEERSDLLKDFFALSENQRKLMIYIANYGGKNIYANETAKKMDMPISSISRALAALVERDYLEKVKTGYQLIVPIYKKLLKLDIIP
jgi:AAA+ ATPase superfamily predicted ATPase